MTTVLSMIASLVLVASTAAVAAPSLTVTPYAASVGASFTLSGSGFAPDSLVESHLQKPDGSEFPTRSLPTDGTGRYSTVVDSTGFDPGLYVHWVVDSEGVISGAVAFEVFTENFDFAADSLSVDGNLFGSGDPDGVLEFFDDFSDGSMDVPPTSAFDCYADSVTESNGLLQLTSVDGVNRFSPPAVVDNCPLGIEDPAYRFVDGQGDTVIEAVFRTDKPEPGTSYGLQLFARDGLDDAISIQLLYRDETRSQVTVSSTYPTFEHFSVPVIIDSPTFRFRMTFDDETNLVSPEVLWGENLEFGFAVHATHREIFETSDVAHVSIVASAVAEAPERPEVDRTSFDTNGDNIADFDLVQLDEYTQSGPDVPDGLVDTIWFDTDRDGVVESPPENTLVCFYGVGLGVAGPTSAGLDVTVDLCENGNGPPLTERFLIKDLNGDGDTADPGEVIPYDLADSDRDGITDDADECPLDPEDFDGYLDNDGCPDPAVTFKVKVFSSAYLDGEAFSDSGTSDLVITNKRGLWYSLSADQIVPVGDWIEPEELTLTPDGVASFQATWPRPTSAVTFTADPWTLTSGTLNVLSFAFRGVEIAGIPTGVLPTVAAEINNVYDMQVAALCLSNVNRVRDVRPAAKCVENVVTDLLSNPDLVRAIATVLIEHGAAHLTSTVLLSTLQAWKVWDISKDLYALAVHTGRTQDGTAFVQFVATAR